METSQAEIRELSATDIGPGEAIMAGFSMVAADNDALGPTVRVAARKAADEFTSSVEVFPLGSRDRQYLDELLMAAVSFAAGLTRRQQERAARINTAEDEREFNFKRIVQTQRTTGVLKGGVQLLVLGGFAYAIVNAMFSLKALESGAPGLDPRYASIATALASALIGSFFKAWWTGRRVDQIHEKYRDALREAKCIYAVEATQEYEFAAQEANLAWQKFTGKAPPMTDAFRVLVVGLLSSEEQTRRGAAARESPAPSARARGSLRDLGEPAREPAP
ncbi:MAG TPA: hypothetical protein VGM03_21725 [Phycisphaerae bacterium]